MQHHPLISPRFVVWPLRNKALRNKARSKQEAARNYQWSGWRDHTTNTYFTARIGENWRATLAAQVGASLVVVAWARIRSNHAARNYLDRARAVIDAGVRVAGGRSAL